MSSTPRIIVVGVISDTHGLLRPEAMEALRDSELIIHAGDIGSPEIIDALMTIAPVRAVRGNTDRDTWARRVPDSLLVDVGAVAILVVHDVHVLRGALPDGRCRAVVSGHSHCPATAHHGGVLLFNPGSAGPRRFNLPVSVGKLYVEGDQVRAKIVQLMVDG